MSKSPLEQFENNLEKAELINAKTTAGGTFIWLPDGLTMRNLFIDEVKTVFKQYGFQEYLFPEFVSISDFNIMVNNIKDFSKGVYFTDKDRLLSPSGESVIYPYLKHKIHTHKDLPIKVFQIGKSFRKGSPRGVFRLNENGPFIEAHSAHKTRQEAEQQVSENIECFKRVMEFLGLSYVFSERPAWGNNPVAERIFAFDTLLPNGETIHLNSVYSQMQTFSRPFDIKYANINGEQCYTYQAEFGFGCRMIFATLFLTMDGTGLNIPPQIAPKQIIILPIVDNYNSEEINEYVYKIYNQLVDDGFRVTIDKNIKKSIGKRRNEAEAAGVPIRIEIGRSEYATSNISLFSRDTGIKFEIPIQVIAQKVRLILSETSKSMKNRLFVFQNEGIQKTTLFETIINIVDKGKIALLPLCCTPNCSSKVEQEVHGEVLGYIESSGGNSDLELCIMCRKQTKYAAYYARHI